MTLVYEIYHNRLEEVLPGGGTYLENLWVNWLSTSYGIRTRDLRLERAMSWTTRRTRLI